jgi:amino acid transporter
MTKKDFFILLIKMFGLSSTVSVLFSILPSVSMYSVDPMSTFLMIIVCLFICILCWLLIFHADKLVGFLRLDKGFDDDRIEFGNLQPVDVIKIAVMIIGGMMFIRSLPSMVSKSFWLIREDNLGNEISFNDKVTMSVQALNLLIGYLLFTNYDVVANYFDRKKDKNTTNP